MFLFRRKTAHNIALCSLFSLRFMVPAFRSCPCLFPYSRQHIKHACKAFSLCSHRCQAVLLDSLCLALPMLAFSQKLYHIAPARITQASCSSARTRIIGRSAQSKTRQLGILHKVFVSFSGSSCLKPMNRKMVCFYRAHKSAYLLRSGSGKRRKKTGCMLILPNGEAPNGREQTERRTQGGMESKAVTADVTLAHNVNCVGNASRLRRVKCKA